MASSEKGNIVEPCYQRLREKEEAELRGRREHIYLYGHITYGLRHLRANLQSTKSLSYSQLVEVLLIANEIGQPLGKARRHPRITAILGEPVG